jgi:tetratricopeptide (TPR) repeat protein
VLEIAVFGVVFALPLILLWPSVDYGFHGVDDPGYVQNNPIVHQGVTLWGLVWALTTFDHSNWHPVTWWSYLIDVELFGVDPGAIRLVSLLWHAVAGITLLAALRRLTGDFWPSVLAAALFVVHPARLESVVWISERKDVLSGLFLALALLLYARRPVPRIAHVAVAMALGVAAKPSVVVLPVLLLLLDVWPLRRFEDESWWRSLWLLVKEKVPLFGIGLVAGILTILAQSRSGAVVTLERLPATVRISGALNALWDYLWSAVWPAGLRFFYGFRRPDLVETLALGVALAGLTVGAFWAHRRGWHHVSVGWLWFVVALLPTLGLIQVGNQARADRYTYLASIGLAIAFAWSLGRLATTAYSRIACVLIGVTAVTALAAVSRHQLAFWRNDQALWQRVVTLEPDQFFGWYRLGEEAVGRGDYMAAVPALERALTLKPGWPIADGLLGLSLSYLGDHEQAVSRAGAAVARDPESALLRRIAADVFARSGMQQAAAAQLLVGIFLAPDEPLLYSALAALLWSDLTPAMLAGTIEAMPDGYLSVEIQALNAIIQEGALPPGFSPSSLKSAAGLGVVAQALTEAQGNRAAAPESTSSVRPGTLP